MKNSALITRMLNLAKDKRGLRNILRNPSCFSQLALMDVSFLNHLKVRGKSSRFLLCVNASGPAPLLWPVSLPSSHSPDRSLSGLGVLSCVNTRNPICRRSLSFHPAITETYLPISKRLHNHSVVLNCANIVYYSGIIEYSRIITIIYCVLFYLLFHYITLHLCEEQSCQPWGLGFGLNSIVNK